jgi:hypothetical protein
VVRRLVGRLPTDRLPARRSGSVSAGLVGALPVRRPWSLMRWWRRMSGRHPVKLPGDGSATESPGLRRAAPAITARRSMLSGHSSILSGHSRARRGVALRSPLAGAPATGPDVRPGHELRMPAGRPMSGHSGRGTDSVIVGSGLAGSRTVVAPGVPIRPFGMAPGHAPTPTGGSASVPGTPPVAGTPSVAGAPVSRGGGLPGDGAPAGPGGLIASIARAGAAGTHHAGMVSRAHGSAMRPRRRPIETRGMHSGGIAETPYGQGSALAAQPEPGPAVHNPQPVGYLRVLGAVPLPPGSEPDPTGAVTAGPAAARLPRRAGLGGGQAPPPVPETASPRVRWEAAVTARPLESPRPLPTAFHTMASAISGRARPPLFTTGPATRHALAAAGALGATTGTVVHLPAPPTRGPSVAAVLAHELTHTRNPVRRPRFFLGGASSLLDDDERSALAAGRDRLAGAEPLIGQARTALGDAGSTAAGIVDQLPVGGGLGAIGDVATRAARAAVLEAAASPLGAASGFANDARGVVTGGLDAASGALSGASGYAQQAAESVGATAGAAGNAVSGAVSNVAHAAADAKGVLDPDKVVEIVERRLLREIERRGGRWAGMF